VTLHQVATASTTPVVFATAAGEWVADFPERESHGYRISQLFSEKVDPGEILREYRTTRYPDRFYNLKIGIPWADLERRLDVMTVLSLCTGEPMAESDDYAAMGHHSSQHEWQGRPGSSGPSGGV
jgi:hypothetical protein